MISSSVSPRPTINPDLADIPLSEIYFITSRLRSYLAFVRITGVRRLTVSTLCEITSGAALMIFWILSGTPSKSGIRVSIVIAGLVSFIRVIVSAQKEEPPSGRSSLSTEVITQCFRRIAFMEAANLSGSSGSGGNGLPVFVAQNLHALVQISPRIIKVAVPLFQHSPIFGQLPLVHIVWRWFSKTICLTLE